MDLYRLTTRGLAADVIDKLVVRDADRVTIVVDMAPVPAGVPESPAIRGAHDDEEVRMADEAAPMGSTVARADSTMVASGFFMLIMSGLGVALWFIKRHNKVQLEPDSIDVVAVRAFGGRHKLALVETCGEKLLLAASDKGVTLLSHLGTPLVPQGAEDTQILSMETVESFEQFMPAAAQTEAPEARVEPEVAAPAKEAEPDARSRREEAHAFELATAKLNSGTLSADLEGLVKLREKRTAKAKRSINGLASHLANRYKANEVAA